MKGLFSAEKPPLKNGFGFVIDVELTKTFPNLRELVANTYFGVITQQKTLMFRWAKQGYEVFLYGTGLARERRIAEDYARQKGFNPFDIHCINVNQAEYTLWFGKVEREG